MDEGDRFGTTRVGAKCGRWNPTAEQVKVLTDLFRSGLRTPSTDQIQTISSHLSSFGKIESKNVFYWFQNHKARERHHKKRRRGGAGGGGGEDHLVLVTEKRGATTRCLPSDDRLGVCFINKLVINSKSLDQNMIRNPDVNHPVQAKKNTAMVTQRNHQLPCTNHFASLHGTFHNANSKRCDDAVQSTSRVIF